MPPKPGRLIFPSTPTVSSPENAEWNFKNQLNWLHKVWPEIEGFGIELETYWTGRVAMRNIEFPGVYGLMHFNAWGNVMAPLMANY